VKDEVHRAGIEPATQ